MNKKVVLSALISLFVIGTVGCGGGSSTTPTVNEKPKDNDSKKGGETSSNLDIVESGDLKVVRNIQSKDVEISFKTRSDEKILDYYIDIDNNENTGFSDSGAKGAEYRVVNHLVDSIYQKIYEVNSSDSTKWVESSKNSQVTYKSNSIVLSSDIVPTKFFTTKVWAYDQNWSDLNHSASLIFDIKLADSGNSQTFSGDYGLSMVVDHNATDISIKLLGKWYDEFTRIYIDSDNNQTGYANLGLWKNFVPDKSIGNGYIYSYDGSSWQTIGSYKSIKRDNLIKFNIKRSILGISPDSDHISIALAVHKDENLDENISGSIPVVNGVYSQAKTLANQYTLD